MSALSIDFIVDASADAVWEVIGRRFDRIGDWATAIRASTAVEGPGPALPGAPFVARVCQTGIRLVPAVTETLVAYDETARSLTYQTGGMPGFVTLARNTWTVAPLDEHRSTVGLRARFDTTGLLGLLGRWIVLAQTRRASRNIADDLRHYVETGTPSPRKQRQLRRIRSDV
jgi:hypothetical protein